MEIETEDRKYALRFFRVQAKVSQLLLEQEPGLSKEARECLQKHHDYCAEYPIIKSRWSLGFPRLLFDCSTPKST